MSQVSQPAHPEPLVPITLTFTLKNAARLLHLAAETGVCPSRMVARLIVVECCREGSPVDTDAFFIAYDEWRG